MNQTTCSMDNCQGLRHAFGYCMKHYARLRKHGDPSVNFKPRHSWPEDSVKSGECLLWPYSLDTHGYGTLTVNKKKKNAHRHAWEQANGAIPQGMLIDHICHTPTCVKIEHLRLATRSQNNANRKGATVKSATGIRNVYVNDRGFYVIVQKKYFGTYSTTEEAAAVAKARREDIFGKFAGGA